MRGTANGWENVLRKRQKPEDLKVALVHDWLTVPGGSEAVFAQVCDMFPGPVYASQIDADRNPFLKGMELHPSFIQRLPYALSKHYLYAPLLPEIYMKMNLSPYDLVLSDSHSFAHGVLRRADALHINYYHTPARSLWLPDIDDRASKTFLHRAVAERLKKMDLEASKRPDVIFANSKTTADRIVRFYKRKVQQVIYPPVETSKWIDLDKKGSDQGLIYWGRLIEYKKVDLAIDAAKETGQKLNIVGDGPAREELETRAAGARNISFWGRLPDEQLKDLIANSKALVFPGYEDFGIVPVEALAAGLPVIAFGSGGVTESVIDSCGVLFPEQTSQALVEAIRKFDRKSFDSKVLKNRAKEFDVSRFRQEYRSAVQKAIEHHLEEQG